MDRDNRNGDINRVCFQGNKYSRGDLPTPGFFYVNFRFRQNREPDQHGSLLKSVFGQALILDDSDFLSVAQKLLFSSKIQVLEL